MGLKIGSRTGAPRALFVALFFALLLLTLTLFSMRALAAPRACTGADDPGLDEDLDGYDNADEIDNGTDPCSAAEVPPDYDGDLLSNLNDPDDDDDGIPDEDDPLAWDAANGVRTLLPISLTWQSQPEPRGGLLDSGLRGVMTNGSDTYLDLLDETAIQVDEGGAGTLTVSPAGAGDSRGAANSLANGLQLGIGAVATCPYRIGLRVLTPFQGVTPAADAALGVAFGPGSQDDYLRLTLRGDGQMELLLEEAGSVTATTQPAPGAAGAPYVDFFLTVNPLLEAVEAAYRLPGGDLMTVGSVQTIPAGWLNGPHRPVATLVATRINGPVFDAVFDWLTVDHLPDSPYCFEPAVVACVNSGGGISLETDGVTFAPDAYFTDGDPYSNTSIPQLLDTVYESERNGVNFSYQFPAATVGDYRVDVYMAEIYFGATGGGIGSVGKRVFDVAIEGETVIDDIDLYATYGPEVPVVKSFYTTVTDGVLDLVVDSDGEDGFNRGKINGVCVYDLTVSPYISGLSSTTNAPFAVNEDAVFVAALENGLDVTYTWDFGDGSPTATGRTVTHRYEAPGTYTYTLTAENVLGSQQTGGVVTVEERFYVLEACYNGGGPPLPGYAPPFAGDAYFSGGETRNNSVIAEFDNTPFEHERFAPTLVYTIPVTGGSEYRVDFYLAEIWHGSPGGGAGGVGSRVFDIVVEGEMFLENYDIYADVGPATAVVQSVVVPVSGNAVDILLDATGDGSGNATIAGICVSRAVVLDQKLLVPAIPLGGG